MKKYHAPEAEVYTFKLEDVLQASGYTGGEYGGDGPTNNEGSDPFGN